MGKGESEESGKKKPLNQRRVAATYIWRRGLGGRRGALPQKEIHFRTWRHLKADNSKNLKSYIAIDDT
jgi:hypothetical protein